MGDDGVVDVFGLYWRLVAGSGVRCGWSGDCLSNDLHGDVICAYDVYARLTGRVDRLSDKGVR
jgi:hypothetical protein